MCPLRAYLCQLQTCSVILVICIEIGVCLLSLSLCRCDVSTFCTSPQPAFLSQLAQDWYMFASETTLIHIWSKWGRMVWTSSHVWINYSPSDVFQIERTLRELVQNGGHGCSKNTLEGHEQTFDLFCMANTRIFGRFRSAVFTWLARANIMCAMWGVLPSDTSTFQMGVSAHKTCQDPFPGRKKNNFADFDVQLVYMSVDRTRLQLEAVPARLCCFVWHLYHWSQHFLFLFLCCVFNHVFLLCWTLII